MASSTITLRTYHAKYVCSLPGKDLEAIRNSVEEYETFEYLPQADGKVALRTYYGTFLSADPAGNVKGTATTITNSEKFEVTKNQEFNVISFKTAFGQYLTAFDDGKVKGHATTIQAWERFFYHLDKKNPSFARRECDIAIIGGGFAGAYMAYRILAAHPEKTIQIFEARSRVSGRLLSYPSEDPQVEDELGGMRIFPGSQPYLKKLLQHFNMTLENGMLVPVSLSDDENFFYALGQRTIKKQYRVKRGDKEYTLGQLSDLAWKNFTDKFPDEDKDTSHAWHSKRLNNISYDDFFRTYGLSRLEHQLFTAWSGYDLYPEPVSSATYHAHSKLYGSDPTDQKYVKNGYATVVRALIDSLETKANFNLKLSTIVTGIQTSEDPETRHLNILVDEEAEPYHADSVIITATLPELKALDLDAVSRERKFAFDAIIALPLFKCFLLFEKAWWKQACGKSSTDLPIRQIHYYGENTLLIYNSGVNATYWNHKFTDNFEKAIKDMLEMVFEVHGIDASQASKLVRFRWKYWPSGSHKWSKGFDPHKHLKLIQWGSEVPDPAIHNHIFVAGDSYSLEQGWVEGAITSAENVLQHCYGLKSWLEVTDAEIEKVFSPTDLASVVEGQTSAEQYYKEKPKMKLIKTKPTVMRGGDGAEEDADAYIKNSNWWTFRAKYGYIIFENQSQTPVEFVGHWTGNPTACVNDFAIETSDDGKTWQRAGGKLFEYKFPGRWGVFRINAGPAKYLKFVVIANKNDWWTGINCVEFYAA